MGQIVSTTLDAALIQVQKYMVTLPKMRKAPDKPPEQINEFPFSVAHAFSGTFTVGDPAQAMKGLHTIVVAVHVARKDLPRDVAEAMPYCESVPNLLFLKFINDNKWNFTVDSIGRIRYTFGPLGWGIGPADKPNTFGFQFFVDEVKLLTTIQ